MFHILKLHNLKCLKLFLVWWGFYLFFVITFKILDVFRIDIHIAILYCIFLFTNLIILIINNHSFYRLNINWLFSLPFSRRYFLFSHMVMVLIQLIEIFIISITSCLVAISFCIPKTETIEIFDKLSKSFLSFITYTNQTYSTLSPTVITWTVFVIIFVIYNLLTVSGLVYVVKSMMNSYSKKAKRSMYLFSGILILLTLIGFKLIGDLAPPILIPSMMIPMFGYYLYYDYLVTWKFPIPQGLTLWTKEALIVIAIASLPILGCRWYVSHSDLNTKVLVRETFSLGGFAPKISEEQFKKVIALPDLRLLHIDTIKEKINSKVSISKLLTNNFDYKGAIFNKTGKDAPFISAEMIKLLDVKDITIQDRMDLLTRVADNIELPNSMFREVRKHLFPIGKYTDSDIKMFFEYKSDILRFMGLQYAIYSTSPDYFADMIENNLDYFKAHSTYDILNTLSLLRMRPVQFSDFAYKPKLEDITPSNQEIDCKNLMIKDIGEITDDNVGLLYYCSNRKYIDNLENKKYKAITRYHKLELKKETGKKELPKEILDILKTNLNII